MENIQIGALEELSPYITRYILPLVKESVQVCVRSFHDDAFNDGWTFGTQLWKNTWNRIKETAEIENNPIEVPIKGNEYFFSIGNATIHHHRVGGTGMLPKSAKAVKAHVDEAQLPLFPGESKPTSFDNIILGISAEPADGLSEIFIGKLEKDTSTDQYRWSERVSLYKSLTTKPEKFDYLYIDEENEAIPVLTLEPVPDSFVKFDKSSNTL